MKDRRRKERRRRGKGSERREERLWAVRLCADENQTRKKRIRAKRNGEVRQGCGAECRKGGKVSLDNRMTE
jgi:hypothetical protein